MTVLTRFLDSDAKVSFDAFFSCLRAARSSFTACFRAFLSSGLSFFGRVTVTRVAVGTDR